MTSGYSFMLQRNPFPGETIHPGPYRMGKGVEDANTYRVGHPLAQRVLERGQGPEACHMRSGVRVHRQRQEHRGPSNRSSASSGWLTLRSA